MNQLNHSGLQELDPKRSREITGGKPSGDTGFWYDLAYAVNIMMYTPRPGWILLNPY